MKSRQKRKPQHFRRQCVSYDTKGLCRSQMQTPLHHAARWRLDLTSGEDRGWRSVSSNAYDTCLIGERYPECADPGSQ